MKRTILVMFAAAMIASCGSTKPIPLSGEWRIVEVNGERAVGETTPFIGFNTQDSTIYGNSSCNRFFGAILYDRKDASAISFGNVGATRMMCANSPMEEQILAAINSVASFSYGESGEAELLDENGVVQLLLTAEAVAAE